MPLIAAALLSWTPAAAMKEASAPPVTAFVDVTVVPMDAERLLDHRTVLVRDGRIAGIGPAESTKVPDGAVRIDAAGRFLMPGLAEMHGHLPNPNQGEAMAASFMTLFVANGVTTVRGMFGFPDHPALRERIARGEVFGPRLFAASPALTGQSVRTPEEGEQLARQYSSTGRTASTS